jgi:hypothetical protein
MVYKSVVYCKMSPGCKIKWAVSAQQLVILFSLESDIMHTNPNDFGQPEIKAQEKIKI